VEADGGEDARCVFLQRELVPINFQSAFDLADEAIVFDNAGSSHETVAIRDALGTTLYEPLPGWAEF
jgi:hypothetical protein